MAEVPKIPEVRKPDMSPQMVQAYKDAVDNLMFLKRQQWLFANYSLLAQAALIFISREGVITPNWRSGLIVMTIVVTVFGLGAITGAQASMTKFRQRLDYIYRNYFSEPERKEMEMNLGRGKFTTEPFTIAVQSVACVMGGILTIVLLNK
jgi:hypothetical protein